MNENSILIVLFHFVDVFISVSPTIVYVLLAFYYIIHFVHLGIHFLHLIDRITMITFRLSLHKSTYIFIVFI